LKSESSKGVEHVSNLFSIDCGEIVLREYCLEDVDSIFEITSQPEVYEFLPDFKTTRERRYDWVKNYEIPSNKRFLAALPHIEGQTYLRFGIILKETNEFIGFCMTGIKEELPSPNREIAYGISKHYRNKGYTTMAVKGLMNFLFEKTDVERLNAIALTHNISSIRVIQKSGFKFVDEIEIEGKFYNHYAVKKSEWQYNIPTISE